VFIHFIGANLDFNDLSLWADHGSMQGLVVITLGHGDVIIELTRYGRPKRVHQSQYAVTTGYVIDKNPHCPDIKQLMKIQTLALHLPPDAKYVLGTAFYFTFYTGGINRFSQFLNKHADEVFTVSASLSDKRRYTAVIFWLIVAKGQVFQFPFQLPDTQPVGQWCMNQHGFPGQGNRISLPGFRPPQLDKLPGQSDQHNTNVIDQRQ